MHSWTTSAASCACRPSATRRKTSVFRFGKLGSEVGILGAGLLITERIFEVPLLKPPRFIIDGVTPSAARAMFTEEDQPPGNSAATAAQ